MKEVYKRDKVWEKQMLRDRRDTSKENEAMIPLQLLELDVKRAQKKMEMQKRWAKS